MADKLDPGPSADEPYLADAEPLPASKAASAPALISATLARSISGSSSNTTGSKSFCRFVESKLSEKSPRSELERIVLASAVVKERALSDL